MVSYRQFHVTEDVAYNISRALAYCKEKGEDQLVFDKGVYRVRSRRADEMFFSVSNHSEPGLKRICFFLDRFEHFTIDGGGSEFVFEDVMTAAAIHNCTNVTIKNCTFYSEDTQNAQFTIQSSGEDWAEMKLSAGGPCYVMEQELYAGVRSSGNRRMRFYVECDGKTRRPVPYATDNWVDGSAGKVTFSDCGSGIFRMEGVGRRLTVGNEVVFACSTRKSCGILLNESRDTKIENVTFYSGIGMGVIAQNCDGVEIDNMATRLRDNRVFSLNADATHFVHCKGKIHIRNSFFEGQLDDALNVHSIYLKIAEKTEHSLIVEFGHGETKGIDILKLGSVVRTVDPDTQLPNGEYTVAAVRKINLDCMEVFLNEDISGIRTGDLLDEVSWVPEVLFENCTVQYNRARGILLASAGKTIIRNNIFRAPGSAILFESSGKYWYESGGVGEVQIIGNQFENCNYAGWCLAVIEVVPREKTEAGRYYHKKIEIRDNVFRDCKTTIVMVNNVESFVFRDNRLENCTGSPVEVAHCEMMDV